MRKSKRWAQSCRCGRHLALHLFYPNPHPRGAGLHLFGAALSFFPAPGSAFFPWPTAAAAVFWVFSLGVFCVAVLEDLEACEGFEVELEGCRRRLPSSPAEDDRRLLLPPSSPIGGCGHRGQSGSEVSNSLFVIKAKIWWLMMIFSDFFQEIGKHLNFWIKTWTLPSCQNKANHWMFRRVWRVCLLSGVDTHHHPEVLQVLELGEVFLQLWVDGLVPYLWILQEGPELLQSIQLTWRRAEQHDRL